MANTLTSEIIGQTLSADERNAEAIAEIQIALGRFTGRTMVDAGEITDVLLDVQQTLLVSPT